MDAPGLASARQQRMKAAAILLIFIFLSFPLRAQTPAPDSLARIKQLAAEERWQEILSRRRPYYELQYDGQVTMSIMRYSTPSSPPDVDDQNQFNRDMWTLCDLCWNAVRTRRPPMDSLLKDIVLAISGKEILHSFKSNPP